MKKEIEVFEYAGVILNAVKTGVLVTGKSGERANPMTISWGTLGIEWNRKLFTVFVRQSRFTKQLLDENPEFTINVPYGNDAKEILAFCGTKSGKDFDKVKELGLTLVEPEKISVPAIKELPLTLECKIIYNQKQDETAIPEYIKTHFYPINVDSSFSGANSDYHTAYYGEIVSAYIVE